MPIGAIEHALHLGSRLRTRLYTFLLASQFKEIGGGSRITPPCRFFGLNQVSLGKNVIVHRSCWLQTIPDSDGNDAPKLLIESNANVGMGATISAAKRVVLEEHVLLAPNVYISDHGHAFENINLPIARQGLTRIIPVVIGRATWLGQNVVVLPGATIGRHCVIGANSVVNSPIPDYSIAVGSPARVVKQYDPETRRWVRVGGEKP